jgi:trehalose 6-phosphate phosphatase
LGALVAGPATSALFLDFDGTLAPIVDDPIAARPLPGVLGVLARLAPRLGLVAIVSGRPVEFLETVLEHPEALHLAGLYGLEERPAGGIRRDVEGVERWRPVVASLSQRLAIEAPDGVAVEEKGLSVTLHWRADPSQEDWVRRTADAAQAEDGLVAQSGRLALELRPPLGIDKGTVVRRLGSGFRDLACFGDDLGDLAAFAAVDELAGEGVRTAKVAVVDPESPEAVARAADLLVEGPAGALELLLALASALDEARPF